MNTANEQVEKKSLKITTLNLTKEEVGGSKIPVQVPATETCFMSIFPEPIGGVIGIFPSPRVS